MRELTHVTLVACLLAVAVNASAAVITLKDKPVEAGDTHTYAYVPDVRLGNYNSSLHDVEMNLGSANSPNGGLYCWDSPPMIIATLINVDLNAIPDKAGITQVNSATLRVYRNRGYPGGTADQIFLTELAESWVEGTGTGSGSDCDGAQWYNRNSGTVVTAAELISDSGVYRIDNVADLANDPVNADKKHVRQASSNTLNSADNHTDFPTLQALIDDGGATRGYFYDDASGKLYVNTLEDVRYYATSDHWATPGGTTTGADPRADITDMEPWSGWGGAGWIEWDVTDIVNGWLLGKAPNYGFRLSGSGDYNYLQSSEYATGAERPELVIDYVPEPCTLALLILGAAGLVRNRKR